MSEVISDEMLWGEFAGEAVVDICRCCPFFDHYEFDCAMDSRVCIEIVQGGSGNG